MNQAFLHHFQSFNIICQTFNWQARSRSFIEGKILHRSWLRHLCSCWRSSFARRWCFAFSGMSTEIFVFEIFCPSLILIPDFQGCRFSFRSAVLHNFLFTSTSSGCFLVYALPRHPLRNIYTIFNGLRSDTAQIAMGSRSVSCSQHAVYYSSGWPVVGSQDWPDRQLPTPQILIRNQEFAGNQKGQISQTAFLAVCHAHAFASDLQPNYIANFAKATFCGSSKLQASGSRIPRAELCQTESHSFLKISTKDMSKSYYIVLS